MRREWEDDDERFPSRGAPEPCQPGGAWRDRRASAWMHSVTPEATESSVRRMLERLPYYGVFDYIVFRVGRSWRCLPRRLQLRRAAEGRCGDGSEARERCG